ncbi:WhiB family transcriptional regulator [Streptomyces xanthophaeus]|uniref:WhiB family transcriptional regulator n=1 Tax=Streptomyces xanthophaeus TaxID=67385 RepID=UPI003668F51C
MTTPLCRSDPERWFSNDRKIQKAVKALCERCPLLTACQDYALKERPPYGIWGGRPRPASPGPAGIWGGLTARARDGKPRPPLEPKRSSIEPVDCTNRTSWAQHQRRGETCEPCISKRATEIEQQRRARLDQEHAEHGGSMRGYHTHVALGEQPCLQCRAANARRLAERRRTAQRPSRTAA